MIKTTIKTHSSLGSRPVSPYDCCNHVYRRHLLSSESVLGRNNGQRTFKSGQISTSCNTIQMYQSLFTQKIFENYDRSKVISLYFTFWYLFLQKYNW